MESDSGNEQEARLRALAGALSDPLRSKLLMAVGDRLTGVTVRQLAEKIGEPPRRIRYHLDALVAQGLVVTVAERKRRGTVERFYAALEKVQIDNLHLFEEEERAKIAAQILKAIIADASAAAAAGTLAKRPQHAILRIAGEVDLEGWMELGAVHEEALHRVEGVLTRARQRLERDEYGDPIHTVSALILFEAPPWPLEADAGGQR